jgi:tetraacyldisaccharide 4'-kinase
MVWVARFIILWIQILLAHLNPLSYLSFFYIRIYRKYFEKKISYNSKHHVISVGNLTVGGAGKTPFSLWLVEELIKRNLSVVVINKNYKAHPRADEELPDEVTYVDESQLNRFGDEALIYKNHFNQFQTTFLKKKINPFLSIFSGPNKTETLEFVEARLPQFQGIILLDDGFQHTRIRRFLDIVLLDLSDPFMFSPYPFGRGREWLWSLFFADMVLLTKSENLNPWYKKVLINFLKCFLSKKTPLLEVQFYEVWPEVSEERPLIVVTGLARNGLFLKNARNRYGTQIVKSLSFSDHTAFDDLQVDKIYQALKAYPKAILLVTEKEAIKLQILYPELPLAVVTLKTEVIHDQILFDRIFKFSSSRD